MKRIASILAAIVAATLLPVGTLASPGNEDNVWLCHRTASDSNPYVLIRVDPDSLPAHLNNLPGHPQKHGRDDFFPTQWQIDERTCDDPPPYVEPPVNPPTDPTPPTYIFQDQPTGWTEVVRAGKVRVRACGDPRLLLTLSNTGNVRGVFTIRVKTVVKGWRTFIKRVPANSTKRLFPIWYIGRSRITIDLGQERLFDGRVTTRGWGKGACPANLRAAQRWSRS